MQLVKSRTVQEVVQRRQCRSGRDGLAGRCRDGLRGLIGYDQCEGT
jgi:hypothetical protein